MNLVCVVGIWNLIGGFWLVFFVGLVKIVGDLAIGVIGFCPGC